MPRRRLNETLFTLHGQLPGDQPLDDTDRDHLKKIRNDIGQALETDGPR